MSNNSASCFVHFMNIPPNAIPNWITLNKAMACPFTDEETAGFTGNLAEELPTGTPSCRRIVADNSATKRPVTAN